jgi:hypothetical protein
MGAKKEEQELGSNSCSSPHKEEKGVSLVYPKTASEQ